MNYLETTKDFYKEAALEPDKGLCCTTSPVWALPGLTVPSRMLEMNYGLVATGFGTLEVRARRPYRVIDPRRYGVEHPIVLESVEVAAIKDPIPDDGPCVFTGRAAIYVGEDSSTTAPDT